MASCPGIWIYLSKRKEICKHAFPQFEFDLCIDIVYTLPMTTTIQKWGNSLAMRLPKELANSFNLKAGSRVVFVRCGDSFKIEPQIKVKIPKYTLEDMVAGITLKNRHKEFDWGKPMGKEIW